jgi:hypothetical protein
MKKSLENLESDFFYLKQLWKEYKKLFSKKESIEEINKYFGECFYIIQLAINNEMVITINRLLDNETTVKNKNLVLESLINYVKEENDKNLLKEKLKNIRGIRNSCNLKELRDKRLAHRDIQQDNSFLFVPYNCIDEIIVEIEEFFKLFREKNKLEYLEYSEYITPPGCENLIEAIKFFNENY